MLYQKKKLSRIFGKLKISNPYGLKIWHMKFEWNWSWNIFWHRRKLRLNFQIDLKALWAVRPYSRSQIIIKVKKIGFDLVTDGPRCPKFLAGLPKLSTVPPKSWTIRSRKGLTVTIAQPVGEPKTSTLCPTTFQITLKWYQAWSIIIIYDQVTRKPLPI